MDRIIDYLKTEFLEEISDIDLKETVGHWIDEILSSSHYDSKRFLICLAIDLKYISITSANIIKIFQQVDFDKNFSEILRQIDLIIANSMENYFVNSNYSDNEYPKSDYVVVLYWSKLFRKFIEASNRAGVFFDWNDERIIHENFFKQRILNLTNVVDWSGWKKLVWVLPMDQIDIELKAPLPGPDIVNNIIDKLGLNLPNDTPSGLFKYDHLLYIKYPKYLDLICFQPTLLCANWKDLGGLYLSFKKFDGYGRTFSNTGKPINGEIGIKERVYRWIDISDVGEFQLIDVGFPDGTLARNIDFDPLYAEIENRF